MDMLTKTFVKHFFLHGLPLFVVEHPVSKLRMPAQTVSSQFDAFLTAEIGYAVSTPPVPYAFFGVYGDGFHVILSGNAVKLLLDQCHLLWCYYVPLVNSDTNGEIIFVGVLYTQSGIGVRSLSPLCLSDAADHHEHQSQVNCFFHCFNDMLV